MMTDDEILQNGFKTKEEFYTFILMEYGDESEQAKLYKIGKFKIKLPND